MTSEERREARYQRRHAAREAKKAARLESHNDFSEVFSYDNLYQSYKRCRRGVSWKASVQRYISTAPLQVYKTYIKLQNGTYKSPGFYEFDLYERGKKRHIRSTLIGERVVQRCLCDNALVPVLCPTFVYDNGASMKNKGYDFCMRRMKQHLHEHYRKHGQEGYILLFDFSKFFDNVSHKLLSKIFNNSFTDESLIKLSMHFVEMFGDVGLGLGSQISQVLALASANKLDHFVKEVLRIRGYGRYMDDGYLIHKSKKMLQKCLRAIEKICELLEIKLNRKKTHIVKLAHGFIWLKARFYLTKTGKVVMKICKASITRMRRKIKKLYKKFKQGCICAKDIHNSWQSWQGYARKFTSWHTLRNMKRLFNRLFSKEKLYVY